MLGTFWAWSLPVVMEVTRVGTTHGAPTSCISERGYAPMARGVISNPHRVTGANGCLALNARASVIFVPVLLKF